MEKITTFFSNFWQKANKKKLIGAAIALFVVIAATIGILIYNNDKYLMI